MVSLSVCVSVFFLFLIPLRAQRLVEVVVGKCRQVSSIDYNEAGTWRYTFVYKRTGCSNFLVMMEEEGSLSGVRERSDGEGSRRGFVNVAVGGLGRLRVSWLLYSFLGFLMSMLGGER